MTRNIFFDPRLPIGTLSADGVGGMTIETDGGPLLSVGQWVHPDVYPRLFEAIGYKYGKDNEGRFKLPDYRAVGNPTHQHGFTSTPQHEYSPHSHGYIFSPRRVGKTMMQDRAVLGYVDKMVEDPNGVSVHFTANTDDYVKQLKRFCENPFITSSEARHMLGLDTSSKENNMSNRRLKTPTEDIQRKDLVVALRVMHARDQDELMDVLATIQELSDNQTLVRVHELTQDKYATQGVHIIDLEVEGILTDAKATYAGDTRSDYKLVIGGKLVETPGMGLAVVTSEPADIDSMIDVVSDNPAS